jgi:microsomal epoxide hydrolase
VFLHRRKHEEHINSFPAYIAPIIDEDGQKYQIHFVGLFSKRTDAIPLMLSHGWPGSFLEFLPILDRVRKQHTPEDMPYHLIVPSLPGYAFSSPPPLDRDFDLTDIARLFNSLMTKSLAFQSYIVQGGDIGSKVSRVIAATYDACKAVHINFCIMPEPTAIKRPISEMEKVGLDRAAGFHRLGSAYALEHATKPATIGFVAGSNPISLLAWVGEKLLDWTDDDLPIDTVLESVSLYWFTNCFATSIYPYRHLFTPGVVGAHENPKWYVNKPMGFSWFPQELAPIPAAWVAETGNLVFVKHHDKVSLLPAVAENLTVNR